MVTKAARNPETRAAAGEPYGEAPAEFEATVYCPGCTAFETVWFLNGRLTATQKFTQIGENLYHSCACPRG